MLRQQIVHQQKNQQIKQGDKAKRNLPAIILAYPRVERNHKNGRQGNTDEAQAQILPTLIGRGDFGNEQGGKSQKGRMGNATEPAQPV